MIDWRRLGLRPRNLWTAPAAKVHSTAQHAGATQEAVVEVQGLLCHLCARRVRRFLQAVPGVEVASCDLQSQQAIMRYDVHRCTPADLEHAVVGAAIAMPLRRLLARVPVRRVRAAGEKIERP